MIVNFALRALAAKVVARIDAFVIKTNHIKCAVRVVGAFGATTHVGVTEEVRFTCTHSIITVCVSSARVWIAFVIVFRHVLCK